MPDHKTFSIKPIRELLDAEIVGKEWADPFARDSKRAKYTNDLNPNTDATHNMDALDFLKTFDDNSLDGVLFDPPYSPRQIKEMYDEIGIPLHDTKSSVWSNWKKEIARIVKPGGKVISFGWNSGGIGKTLNMEIKSIILVAHGGNHNDTIITVETKKGSNMMIEEEWL
jgi:tRNA1(Val) A37 N6-methylase TrmN6